MRAVRVATCARLVVFLACLAGASAARHLAALSSLRLPERNAPAAAAATSHLLLPPPAALCANHRHRLRHLGASRPCPRVIQYTVDSWAGLSDRKSIITKLLDFAVMMDATLSFPMPCAALSQTHQGPKQELVNCSTGWEHFFSSSHDFVGYSPRIAHPGCENRLKLNELLSSNDDELATFYDMPSFCLVMETEFGGFVDAFDAFVTRMKNSLWSKGESHALAPVTIDMSKGVLDLAARQQAMLDIWPDKYGAIKIRRHDKTCFYHCTEAAQVVRALEDMFSTGSASWKNGVVHNMTWLVFAHVYEYENYWGQLRGALDKSTLLSSGTIGTVVFEPDMTLLAQQEDNYFLYSAVQKIVWQAHMSMGTSPQDAGRVHLCSAHQ